MQFKNIILSAALLAMVNAAPIDNVHTEDIQKDATGTASSASIPTTPNGYESTPKISYDHCVETYGLASEHGVEEDSFMKACNACLENHFNKDDLTSYYKKPKEDLEPIFDACAAEAEDNLKAKAVPRGVPGVPEVVKTPEDVPPKTTVDTPTVKSSELGSDAGSDVVKPDAATGAKTPAVGAVEVPVKGGEAAKPASA